MDYKIKFEYKGMGKQATGIRQKVLQSQKSATAKAATTVSSGRETLTSLKTLNSSILKLIASNKDLTNAIKKGTGITGGGGGGIPGGGGGGFGRIGASIPVLGAGIAAIGFAMSKINQIGKAYIAKTAEQIGNVGVGGFRGAQGIYMGTQMGAGMKEYAMARGQFATTFEDKRVREAYLTKKRTITRGRETPEGFEEITTTIPPQKRFRTVTRKREVNRFAAPQTALDIGAIYGLSAPETLRTAGQLARAGANYQGAAYAAAGRGIQTEIPTLLTGMAGILTDAIREGINTSDMSSDMADEIAKLAIKTPGKSVDAAISMIKSFQGVQRQVAAGKMGTVEGLYTTKASQDILMEKITGTGGSKYLQQLQDGGFISTRQQQAMSKLKKGADFSKLLQVAPGAAFSLLRKQTAETDPTKLQRRTMDLVKKSFGDTPEGRQRFYDFASTQGWSQTQSQLETILAPGGVTEGGDIKKRGQQLISARAKGVRESAAGVGVQRAQQLEGLLLRYGSSFAATTIKVENSLLEIAKTATPAVINAMSGFETGITVLTGMVNTLNKKIRESIDEKGGVSVGKFFKSILPSFSLFDSK